MILPIVCMTMCVSLLHRLPLCWIHYYLPQTRLSKLSSCITDIHEWMTRNMLMLNSNKTEFFLAASPHNLAKLHNVSLQIGGNKINTSSKIKKKKKKKLRYYIWSNHVYNGSREHYCQNCQLSSQEDIQNSPLYHCWQLSSVSPFTHFVSFWLCELTFVWNCGQR